jgi:hypothetical protein
VVFAKNSSHYLEARVSPLMNILTVIGIFAWESEDLFLCQDGYGLKSGLIGNIDPFAFSVGLYTCGGLLKSQNAGNPCLS